MKTKKGIILGLIAIALIVASFFMGSDLKEREYNDSRVQRCAGLISFALDKVENEDISNQDIMKTLISNVYAAYVLCDDPVLQTQLHDLWNFLIFEGDDSAATKDILSVELESISDAISRKNSANFLVPF